MSAGPLALFINIEKSSLEIDLLLILFDPLCPNMYHPLAVHAGKCVRGVSPRGWRQKLAFVTTFRTGDFSDTPRSEEFKSHEYDKLILVFKLG